MNNESEFMLYSDIILFEDTNLEHINQLRHPIQIQVGSPAGKSNRTGMEEGPRLQHFRQAFGKMLQASVKNCT